MAQPSRVSFRRSLTFGGLALVALAVLPACGTSEPTVGSSDTAPRTKNAALPASELPPPIARFTFDGNFDDSLRYGFARELDKCGAPNGLLPCNETSSFGTTADGDGYWSWTSTSTRGGGFTMTTKAPITPPYSIGLRFELSQTNPNYRKIIDYMRSISDNGFYFLDGRIMFFPENGNEPTGPRYADNTIIDLVATLTVDRLFTVYAPNPAGGMTKLYEYRDDRRSADPAVVGGGSLLGFFFDDRVTKSEAAPSGKIYELRLWNSALTEGQVGRVVPPTTMVPGNPGSPTTTISGDTGGMGGSSIPAPPPTAISTTTSLFVAPPTTVSPSTSVFRNTTTTTKALPPTTVPRTTTTSTTLRPPTATTAPRATTTTLVTTTTKAPPATTVPGNITPTTKVGYNDAPIPGPICQNGLLAPTGLVANPADPAKHLTWQQPAANKGRVARVAVQVQQSSGSWQVIRALVNDLTRATIEGVGPGTRLKLRVVNVGIDSCATAPSTAVDFIIPAVPAPTTTSTTVAPRQTTTTVYKLPVGYSCIDREAELAPTNVRLDDTTFPLYTLTWTQPSAAAIRPLLDELASYGNKSQPRWTYTVEASTDGGKVWRPVDSANVDGSKEGIHRFRFDAKSFQVRVINRVFGSLNPCISDPSAAINVTQPIVGISCVAAKARLAPTNVVVDYSHYPRFKMSWTQPDATTIQPLIDELTYYKDPRPRNWDWVIEFSTDEGKFWRTLANQFSRVNDGVDVERNDLTSALVALPYPLSKTFLVRVRNTSFGNLRNCPSDASTTTEVTKPMVGSSCVGKEAALAPKNLTVDRSKYPWFNLSWTQPTGSILSDLHKELAYYRKPIPTKWTYQFEYSTDGGQRWLRIDPRDDQRVRKEDGVSALMSYFAQPIKLRVVNLSYGFLEACKPNPSAAIDVVPPALGASCVGRAAELAPRNLLAQRVGGGFYDLTWAQATTAQIAPLVDELRSLGQGIPSGWTTRVEVSTNGGATWQTVDTFIGRTKARVRGVANAQARIVYEGYGALTKCVVSPSQAVAIRPY